MSKHSTEKERRRLIERYRRSGLTQVAFAEKHGVKVGTFRSWLYTSESEPSFNAEQRFVEVHAASSAPVVFLRLGAGVELELSELPPVPWLLELVRETC